MEPIFFTCGPTQLYPTVVGHMKAGFDSQFFSLSHRGSKVMECYGSAVAGLRTLMSIPADYEVFFISSGTEGMERVIQNCVNATSGHLINGAFSKRWLTTSQQLGKKTEDLTVPDGSVPDISKASFLKSVELICVTHNETSTGAMIQPAAISALHTQYPEALIAVDIVSSAPTVELDFTSTDCVIFSVQKGFGLPAGLGVMVVSPRAMATSAKLSKKISVGTYHSFAELKKYADKSQTPDTPNVLGIYLLSKVVADFNAVGIAKLRAQTTQRAERLYQLISPFVKEKTAQSLTTIVAEVAGGSARVIDALKAQGIMVSSGYGSHKDSQIRIGNFPAHTDSDFERLLATLEKALRRA